LLLYRQSLRGETRQRLIREFVSRGVKPGRLDFRSDVSAEPALAGRWHLPLYREIDVCLDTFPWSGHTSACEALWMGVPVITLAGNTHVARMVASVLTQVGRPDWIAQTRQEYVSQAVEMSRSVTQLRSARTTLRELVRNSRLCNSAALAREIERRYRQIWRNWCASGAPA
jgi:predicted O-linked N-acetylglucosamine transferase (SPINDLY family)